MSQAVWIALEDAVIELNLLKERGYLFTSVEDYLSTFIGDPGFRSGMEFRLNITYVYVIIAVKHADRFYPVQFMLFDNKIKNNFFKSNGVDFQTELGIFHSSLLKHIHEGKLGYTLYEERGGLIIQKLKNDNSLSYWDLHKSSYRQTRKS